MADFDTSKLIEWQQDLLKRASQAQRLSIVLRLQEGWEIIQGRFGGDTELEKDGEKISINQDGQIIGT